MYSVSWCTDYCLCFFQINDVICEDLEGPKFCNKMKKKEKCGEEWVYEKCLKTCGKCEEDTTKTTKATTISIDDSCQDIWLKENCQKLKDISDAVCNVNFFYLNCLKTCGKCSVVCEDIILSNTCEKFIDKCHIKGIYKNCMKSCGCSHLSCQDIWNKNKCKDHKKKCDLEEVATNCQQTCKLCETSKTFAMLINIFYFDRVGN